MRILSFTAAAVLGFAPLAAETYNVDAVHSHALFAISHAGFSTTYGRFNDVSGAYVWEADPTKSSIRVAIRTASVDTGRDEWSQKRDEHLRGPDFLSAKEFPEMSFVSKRIAKGEGNVYTVTGDFTLRGVTQEMTIPVTLLKEDKDFMPGSTGRRIGFETRFTIKRSAFGMSYGLPNVGDDVTITFSSEGVSK